MILDANIIAFKVTNSGIGIENQSMYKITETFYRAPNARLYKGTGIGLSLAENIIGLHGGNLSFIQY